MKFINHYQFTDNKYTLDYSAKVTNRYNNTKYNLLCLITNGYAGAENH